MNVVRKIIFKKWLITILLVVMVVMNVPNKAAASEKTINYRLKWLINASVAGDIYAVTHGYFEQAGLEVNMKPGGPERDAIRELELGYAQFGVASADQVIRAAEKGASVIVVAQLFQTNPLQWIYRADDVTLTSLQDFKGKKVGITYGGNDETIMKALLAKGGIQEKELVLASVRYDYTPFFRKKVEIWPVYRNTQGVFLSNKLEAAGEKAAFFNPSDFGIRFVANSVVTTEKMMKENPRLVKKFVTALLAGWEAALAPENEQKSIAAIGRHDQDSRVETISQQIESTRLMVKPTAHYHIGTIDKSAWMQTEKIMLEQKLITTPVNIEKRLRQM